MQRSQSFITIDDSQHISLAQAFQYLQLAGRLDEVLGDILRQHLLAQELLRTDLAIAPPIVENAIADLRQQHDLLETDRFAAWLISQDLDEPQLRQRLQRDLQIQRLKEKLTETKGQEHFIDRKLSLDRVVLSRIEVASRDLAEELQQQIADGSSFELLAQDYSLASDRIFNGMMGLLSRASLSDLLRAAVDVAVPGDVVGPLETEQGWALYRVEHLFPASLEDPEVLQTVQDELLDQWLLDKLQGLNIEVQVGEEDE